MKKLALLSLLALALAVPALAQEPVPVPVFSLTRLSVGIGADYAWVNRVSTTLPDVAEFRGWDAVVAAAYNLTPTTDLVAKMGYSIHDGAVRSTVGVRFTVFTGTK